jgi:hypothetical protein
VGGGYQANSGAAVVFVARVTTPGVAGTYTVTADDGPAIGTTVQAFAYCVPA